MGFKIMVGTKELNHSLNGGNLFNGFAQQNGCKYLPKNFLPVAFYLISCQSSDKGKVNGYK